MKTVHARLWSTPLLLGLLGIATPASAGSTVKVYFSPGPAGHQAIAAKMKLAKKTIDIAMYSISPGRVAMWKPLADAVKRGVKCRVVLHKANTSSVKSKASALENIGCDVRFVSGTMHQKFAIIDGKYTSTGSANWSTGAATKYSENIIVFSGFTRSVAKDFNDEFTRLWTHSAQYPVSGRVKYPRWTYGNGKPKMSGTKISLFTSQNSKTSTVLNDALIKLIANTPARSKLDIAVAHYNTTAIKDAVCKAHQRGVKVRVLTDLGEYSIGSSKVKALESCKNSSGTAVPVRYKAYGLTWYYPRARLMHHKFLITSKSRLTASGRTYRYLATGSYNWSTTAEKKNKENLQIIRSPGSTITAFQREFNKLWNQNRDKLAKIRAAFSQTKRCHPVHWDTPYFDMVIALTRDEYREIRGKGFAAGELFVRANAKASCIDVEKKKRLYSMPSGKFLD